MMSFNVFFIQLKRGRCDDMICMGHRSGLRVMS